MLPTPSVFGMIIPHGANTKIIGLHQERQARDLKSRRTTKAITLSRPYVRFEGTDGWVEADYNSRGIKAYLASIESIMKKLVIGLKT